MRATFLSTTKRGSLVSRLSAWPLVWSLFALATPPQSRGQMAKLSLPAAGLPEAPIPAGQAPGTTCPADVSGVLVDANGGLVSGANVVLASSGSDPAERTTASGGKGEFSFSNLPFGPYRLTVTAPGMEAFVLADLNLEPCEHRQLRQIVLAVAGTTTEVRVVVTRTELAQEQVKAAEHQRVLGVLPNFYSSYIWDAAPLNTRQKFNLAFHSITDPVEFVGSAVVAGAEQATDTFSGYGQGAQGYAKRFGAAYADEVAGRMIGSALLPSLLHQDPRYFYMGSGTVRTRVFYAISRAVVTRGDSGRTEPNYSRVFGSLAAGALANLYYPQADRGLGLTLTDGFVNIAGHAADNLIREFLLRRLTPNVPVYAQGKQ